MWLFTTHGRSFTMERLVTDCNCTNVLRDASHSAGCMGTSRGCQKRPSLKGTTPIQTPLTPKWAFTSTLEKQNTSATTRVEEGSVGEHKILELATRKEEAEKIILRHKFHCILKRGKNPILSPPPCSVCTQGGESNLFRLESGGKMFLQLATRDEKAA